MRRHGAGWFFFTVPTSRGAYAQLALAAANDTSEYITMPSLDLLGGEGYDEDLDNEGEPSHGNNNGRRGGGRGRGRGAVRGSGAAAGAAAAAAGGSDDAAHARQRQAHDRHTARSVQDITLPDAGIAELMDRYAEEAGVVQCPFFH